MIFTDFLILGIILGGLLFYFLDKKINRLKIKKRLSKAKKAEKNAIKFLEEKGYSVVAIQEKQPIVVYIDDKPYPSHVQVDFIVKKGGKRYVVEVKTGQKTRATTAPVRRQLLEYFLVFKPHGILLLDMENGTLKKIEFQWGNNLSLWTKYLVTIFLGLLVGIISWWFFR